MSTCERQQTATAVHNNAYYRPVGIQKNGFPTTASMIGLPEVIDPPRQDYEQKGLSFKRATAADNAPCYKNWAEQTFETTNKMFDKRTDRNRETCRPKEWEVKPAIPGKSDGSGGPIDFPPAEGLINDSHRTASRWVSRSHETYVVPNMPPPVQKVENRLGQMDEIVPAGTLLETGSPPRNTAYYESYGPHDRDALAQHFVRSHTTSHLVDPNSESLYTSLPKPKNDPTATGFVFAKCPTGARQVVEVVDPAEPPPRVDNTRPTQNQIGDVTTQRSTKTNWSTTYKRTMKDPMVQHDRVLRGAQDWRGAHSGEYDMGDNERRYTIPRVFTHVDGVPAVNRVAELEQRGAAPDPDPPRSKITTVGTLLSDPPPTCHGTP